jgi:hypothetical protein
VIDTDGLDHLPDRQRFPAVSADIAGLEPVEAKVGIVLPSLFRIEDDEPVLGCQVRPTRAAIIRRRRLRAAMKYHDQGGITNDIVRNKELSSQIARI